MDNYPVDSTELRGRGTKGVMSAVAGLGLLGVSFLIGIPIIGWILGGALVVVGIGGAVGKSRTDKATRNILLAVGVAGLATLIFHRFTGFIISAGGLGLIAYGAWNIFRFVKGLRDRA